MRAKVDRIDNEKDSVVHHTFEKSFFVELSYLRTALIAIAYSFVMATGAAMLIAGIILDSHFLAVLGTAVASISFIIIHACVFGRQR